LAVVGKLVILTGAAITVAEVAAIAENTLANISGARARLPPNPIILRPLVITFPPIVSKQH
jgi:uncharacterized protein with ACT and thioredoxin-like domain